MSSDGSNNINSNSNNISEYFGDGSAKENTIGKIQSIDNFIILGNQKFYRDELVQAFGGTLNPERYSKPPARVLGNPVPMGLSAFGITTFVLSLINAQAMGVTTPNIVVSLAFFNGGLMIFLSGVWDMALGNTFGGTALTSYGAFWASYGAIFVKNFGIQEAYGDNVTEFNYAVGFFILGWVIFTTMCLLCTLKSTYAFCAMFFFLDITFLLLTIGCFTEKVGVTKAGGVFGVITAFLGWYNAYAGIANKTNTYVRFRPFFLPGAS